MATKIEKLTESLKVARSERAKAQRAYANATKGKRALNQVWADATEKANELAAQLKEAKAKAKKVAAPAPAKKAPAKKSAMASATEISKEIGKAAAEKRSKKNVAETDFLEQSLRSVLEEDFFKSDSFDMVIEKTSKGITITANKKK